MRPASLGYGRVLVRLLCQIRCYEAKGKGLANMPWDTELSNEQRSAASHVGRHARLLAGPGTGKTRCLTKRIVYLIEEQGVDPSRILVLTFTRVAKAEIRQRVLAELGNEAQLPHISTLSSFALRTILSHGAGVRLPQPIRIADDYEERWIIEEELKRLLGLSRITEARQLMNQLSADWEQLTADANDWENRFPNPQFLGAWQEHREIYGYTLRAELVYQLKNAVQEGAIELDLPPRHILVDEYQDLNACDLATIRYLSEGGVELYAAGDDDQSIYGFRYAYPDGIRRFPDEYVPSNELTLTECRRCAPRILDLALYVAQQDPRRIDKPLMPVVSTGAGEVRLLRYANQSVEAQSIAALCQQLVNEQAIRPDEILILVRTDRNRVFSNPIREALTAAGLPVATVSDPLEPLNRENGQGRRFLALLHLFDNDQDGLAWRTILRLQRNGIGNRAFEDIYDLARRRGLRFFDALQQVCLEPALIPRGNLVQRAVDEVRQTLNSISLGNYQSVKDFTEALANQVIPEAGERAEVMGVLERLFSLGDFQSLSSLLRSLSTSLDDVEQETESGAINIMTMHQAKGLTASAVFVVAAEDVYIPGKTVGSRIEDERRLLYVSLTRAKTYLFITHCRNRVGAQTHTGRNSGNPRRLLTRFLQGGPIRSIDGTGFMLETNQR